MTTASFNLADLNGRNGFAINIINIDDQSFSSVSNAGDINGDGFNDLIIGVSGADPSGQSYVIFGSSEGFPDSIELANLDGSNGFSLNGIEHYDSASSSFDGVGAGDINGDGIDDLIIGAPGADPNGDYSGQSYVIFGSSEGFPASIELANLDGSNGFALNGIDRYDRSGISVAGAGDINSDGIDDLIVGAFFADPNPNDNIFSVIAGQSYVIFGSSEEFPASIELANLDGSNGFALNGVNAYDRSGISVSGAGDINGDGIDDLIVGAVYNIDFFYGEGQSYVVFGSEGEFPASIELANLDGSNGFSLNGIDRGDLSGSSVSGAGDINGDGIDDLIIGAPGAGISSNYSDEGQSYVVFGSSKRFAASIDLADLDGNNGFTLNGINAYDGSGNSVSGAGDINGDGIDDLIISAPSANNSTGQSYVVFGSTKKFPAILEFADLDGTNGFVFTGLNEYEGSGSSVSGAGDINGDGFDDLIIGAEGAETNGERSGRIYVVFGFSTIETIDGTPDDDLLIGTTSNERINGFDGNDNIIGKAGEDSIDGGLGDDLIVGQEGNDSLTGSGNQDKFAITLEEGTDTITDFGGVGKGGPPPQEVIDEVDILQFFGEGLTAENMLLTQQGSDLEITFEGSENTKVILQDFALEDLENRSSGIGNILFDGQQEIQDNYAVFNADSIRSTVFNRNTVTFLNDLDNNTQGFDDSDDVINGQGGNDTLSGLSGNDLLRGGTGNDVLAGGAGDDVLVGGAGKSTPVDEDITPTIGLNFTGSTFFESCINPPDTNGALGSDHIVELINGRYKVYDKDTGVEVQDSSLNEFWEDAGVTFFDDAIDPRVLYDPFSNRWFASSGDREGEPSTNVLLAVSNSSDPTQGWTGFGLEGISQTFSEPVADFPILGFNRDGIYLSAFIFGKIPGDFSASVVAVPKQDLLAETPTVANATVFENLPSTIIHPIVDLDNTTLPHPLLTETNGAPFRRFNIDGTISSPIIDTEAGLISVEQFNNAITVGGGKQPGTNKTLDIVDSRFKTNLILQNGAIWGAQDVNNNGRAAIRWFQIDADTNELLQEGLIADPELDLFYGSIAVNDFDDVVIGFNGSGETQFVSSLVVVGDTFGGETIFSEPILLEESTVSYEIGPQGFAGPDSLRWGDYSATVVDPENPFTFWTFQTLAFADDAWSTQLTQLTLIRGGQDLFQVRSAEGTDTIMDFGGVGRGTNPPQDVIDKVDIIQFFGSGLIAKNMLLTQKESDLEITFEGVENTKVILQNFALEDLENRSNGIGNILFDGQQEIQDDFDIFDADSVRSTVFNPNTVTFLNDLDNTTQGFEDSNDVINGQGGSDILLGRSGDDLLRGGEGDDVLLDGGAGNDRLDGGAGDDGLFGGADADQFVLRAGNGADTIFDFEDGIDSLLLADGLEFEQLGISSSNGDTLISITDTSELLASLIGVNASDISSEDFAPLV